jgi:hypothetical protein
MKGRAAIGVFDSAASAEKARAALLRAGVALERVAVSQELTSDAIAAEAPGQSYEHQTRRGSDRPAPGEQSSDTDRARYNSAIRTGACVVTVAIDSSGECRRVRDLMRSEGARITMERPAHP